MVPSLKASKLQIQEEPNFNLTPKAAKKPRSQSKSHQEKFASHTHRRSAFCSIQAFNRLDEAQPHHGGLSALLRLLTSILISFKNTFMETPRIMFDQISGQPVTQSS